MAEPWPPLQGRDEKLHNGYADGRETAHARVDLQSCLRGDTDNQTGNADDSVSGSVELIAS